MLNSNTTEMNEIHEKLEVSVIEHAPNKPQLEQVGEQMLQEERELTLWQSAVHFRRVLLFTSASLFAGGVFAYDVVASGATVSMPSFLISFGAVSETGTLYLPSIWNSLYNAMSSLMQAIGGFGVGYVSDTFGRKWCCVAACLISLGGVGMQYAADSRGLLLGGKILNGLAIGAVSGTSTAWAAEISPFRLRGPVQSAIVLWQTLMQALALIVTRIYVADIESGYRHVFAVMFVWAGATAVIFTFVPESPNWLILKDRPEAALKAMTRLYGSSANVTARFAALQKHIQEEAKVAQHAGTGTYRDAFRGSNLKRTLTVMWLFLGTGLNGAALLNQSTYFLLIAGLEAVHSYDVAIGGFGLAIVTIVLSWFFMDKIGRRPIWLVGNGVNVVVMVVIGALNYVPSKSALWAIAVIMNVLISWQIVTMTSVAWVITAELSSYQLRGKTQAIAVISLAITTWLFLFTVPYIYNTDAGNLGARTGFVFAGSSLLLFVVSYFLVPELKGFTTEEVDWLYENHIPVRHFQKYADGRAKRGVLSKSESQA